MAGAIVGLAIVPASGWLALWWYRMFLPMELAPRLVDAEVYQKRGYQIGAIVYIVGLVITWLIAST